jgi:hypothetical protein
MSTTTDTTPKDPYIRGTDETVLLDLRELRAQEAADKAAREAAAAGSAGPGAQGAPGAPGTSGSPGMSDTAETPGTPGAELERYHGSHRRDAVLYADGGTAIPLDRVREVCHDLRQPVAAILMLASAAELRPDVPERVRDVLQEIMSQTEEISATVRQFLDDAKQGVDGLGEPVPCNVAGLAAESVERWRATFDGDLALAAAEDPLHVTVDPILFKRALGNVLSNGTRAAGDAGRVRVTVRRFETAEGERAVIEVDDSGPGFGNIPAGHGLGLAVVRRTIEAAGGSVEFAEGPMGGALVRLVLPVTPVRPLSAGDELTRTFHGEISLSQLAAELAAGAAGRHPALAEFEDDDFDDFDDFDEDDEDDFAEHGVGAHGFDQHAADQHGIDEHGIDQPVAAPASGHSLAGGHAFLTRLSAWPEPMAISGAPEQLAIGGETGAGNPFGARPAAAELPPAIPAPTAAATEAAAPMAAASAIPAPTAAAAGAATPAPAPTAPPTEPPADNRSYFGLPTREPATEQQAPEPVAEEHGFFSAPERQNPTADRGYFGLPLKNDPAASAPAQPEPHSRLYGTPAEAPAAPLPQRSDISAHPVPTGLLSAHHTGPQAPQASQPAQPQPAIPAVQPTTVQPAAVQPPTAPPAGPVYDPTDTQPLHIIPTGQDDTALASIQLPSQANLTHPPRIPASALRPVAEVQLSLLPGGAF